MLHGTAVQCCMGLQCSATWDCSVVLHGTVVQCCMGLLNVLYSALDDTVHVTIAIIISYFKLLIA